MTPDSQFVEKKDSILKNRIGPVVGSNKVVELCGKLISDGMNKAMGYSGNVGCHLTRSASMTQKWTAEPEEWSNRPSAPIA